MSQKRLRIGIFVDSFYPEIDGVVMVTDHVASALAAFHDVTVIVPDMGDKTEYKRPYEIIRVSSIRVPKTDYRAGFLLPFSEAYRKILKKHFDVIHIHSPFILGRTGIHLAHRLHIPVFCTAHSRYYFELKKTLKSEMLSRLAMRTIIHLFNICDKCIVVNDPLADEIRQQGYRHEPLVIYNATDMKPPANKEKSVRTVNRLFGLREDDTVLLFVGRITSTKNIYFLLESLRLLKQDGVKFRMLFVGSGPDDAKLRERIRKYRMQDCVKTVGRISDRELLSAIYARADLFLFPSVFVETFGLVRIEAAVNGTPGLFIKNSMAASAVKNNVNGFLAPLDTVKYKDRIKEILSDPARLRAVSVRARETMAETWENIAQQHDAEYCKVIRAYRQK